jgi:hypothetical protein
VALVKTSETALREVSRRPPTAPTVVTRTLKGFSALETIGEAITAVPSIRWASMEPADLALVFPPDLDLPSTMSMRGSRAGSLGIFTAGLGWRGPLIN